MAKLLKTDVSKFSNVRAQGERGLPGTPGAKGEKGEPRLQGKPRPAAPAGVAGHKVKRARPASRANPV